LKVIANMTGNIIGEFCGEAIFYKNPDGRLFLKRSNLPMSYKVRAKRIATQLLLECQEIAIFFDEKGTAHTSLEAQILC